MKALLEMLKALYSIKDAIINKKNNSSEGDGDNQQSDLSWYDALKQLYGIAPVAINNYGDSNNIDNIRFLKDIPFTEKLPFENGIALYDDNTLFSYSGNGHSYTPFGNFGYMTYKTEDDKEFEELSFERIVYNNAGRVTEFKEINGKMLYEYYYRNA